jgi:hypothetical protein
MIQSPLYQEIVEEAERKGETRAKQQDILEILEDRFGPEVKDLEVELRAVEFDRPKDLFRLALRCSSLEAFRERLLS